MAALTLCGVRPTSLMSVNSRIPAIATVCSTAWGPLPNTTRREASGAVRWSAATAEVAGVRSEVRLTPSTNRRGVRVRASIST